MSGEERSFALRSWGWAFDRRDRIDAVVRFHSRLYERFSATSIIPEVLNWHRGNPILEADHTFWTLSPWLAGQPIRSSESLTDKLLHQAVSTLAELHAIGSAFESRREIPLGLVKRHRCILDWQDGSKRIAWKTDFD